jgi:DNA primase
MEYQGLGFVDAVKMLAESIGMQVPQVRSANPEASVARERQMSLEEVMQLAAGYFKQQLKSAPVAISYLKGRQWRSGRPFGLGYAPGEWQNLQAVFRSIRMTSWWMPAW